MVNSTREIHIQIRFTNRFRSQVVEKEDWNPLTGMTIEVDGTYVWRSAETTVGDYMTGNLIRQFEALPGIIRNESQVVEYYDGPMWLVFEPVDSETVRMSGCHTIGGVRDPSQRIPVDSTHVVTKNGWISELVRETREYVETICNLNPSLADHPSIQTLSEYISRYDE
ncbi:hypothetical protein [Haloferax sp. DFSO60]|uniref:hypothetical protein n=1 Tax=Haloferax sp. DFSO60 TaxID=3388652 RepID=UPI00397AEACE